MLAEAPKAWFSFQTFLILLTRVKFKSLSLPIKKICILIWHACRVGILESIGGWCYTFGHQKPSIAQVVFSGNFDSNCSELNRFCTFF
jgi:hypothetical protein